MDPPVRRKLIAVGNIGRWQAEVFRSVPADTCALLRIAIGTLGVTSLAGLTPVSMLWSPAGLVPTGGSGFGVKVWLLNAGLGEVAALVFWSSMVVAFALLAAGYRTRLMTAICFLEAVLQAHWNPLPLSMAWQVEVCVLFALLFANSGGVLSVDSWLSSRRGLPSDDSTPIWPLFVLRYQIALIYLSSGLWKLIGTSWRDGSALHYVLANHVYARFPGLVSPAMDVLATIGTYLILGWELAFPIMVLRPRARQVALISGIIIHLGIWATVEVGSFSWIMMASYLAFLDPVRVVRVTRAPIKHWPAAICARDTSPFPRLTPGSLARNDPS